MAIIRYFNNTGTLQQSTRVYNLCESTRGITMKIKRNRLTVVIDEELITRLKKQSEDSGIYVSRLVENYLNEVMADV